MTNAANNTVIIVISNNADALNSVNPTHTVEAEFGLVVVAGSEVTLAHHGERSANPCPCLGDNIARELAGDMTIAVSHFDLDTLGGVMRCLGMKDYDGPGEEDMFWQVAAMVDTMGVHKLGKIRETLMDQALIGLDWGGETFEDQAYFFSCEWDDTVESLNAFWAWSENNRIFAPRDGSTQDVTAFFLEAIRVTNLLIEGDDNCREAQALYQKGREWNAAKRELNHSSIIDSEGAVLIRQSDQFVNHLYDNPISGELHLAVVSLNTKFGSVTLSLADPIEGVSCCDIAQSLWGPEAGGHAGIAGSPRGQRMLPDDAESAALALNLAIEAAIN